MITTSSIITQFSSLRALHWFVQIGIRGFQSISIHLSAGCFGGIRKGFGFGKGIYNNPKG